MDKKIKGVKCPLPPMGWNSYCTVNCDPTEEIMLSAADLLVDLGLADAGYVYVNLDDGWLKKERDAEGRLMHRDDIFPHGMKYLTNYIHAKGLKAGTYLGCGLTTWNGDAGSLGHEFEDARYVAECGFDYLKYDRHPTQEDPPRDTVSEYIKMGLAVKECGRDIVYNLCEHGTTSPWLWASPVGQLWRTGKDIRDNWRYAEDPERGYGVLDIIDFLVADISPYGHSGGFNDPDMIVCGMREQNDWMGGGCTTEEYRSVMAIWSMLAAPLLIGADLRKIDKAGLDILKNPGIIAIDQDPLCVPARRVYHDIGGHDIWVRPLNDFKWAVAVTNRTGDAGTFGFTLEDVSLSKEVPMKATDAWTGEVVAHIRNGEYSQKIARHDTAVIILEPEF